MPVLIDAARERARSHLRGHERALLAGEFPGFSLPLHPPTAAGAVEDVPATREFIRQWEGRTDVEYASRNWTGVGLGHQVVPVRLHLSGIDELVEFSGLGRRWQELLVRRDHLLGAGFRTAAVLGCLRQWRSMELPELDRAVAVVDWFQVHPDSGLLPRAVAVEGVHGKWLESHRVLVETLLADRQGGDGRAELGLAVPEGRVRLRFHAADAPGGLSDVEVVLSGLAGLPVPAAVVMVENLETFLSLPTRPGVVVAWGAGYRAVDIVRAPFFTRAPLLYWGDLDLDGYKILDAVRRQVPGTRSVLMDRQSVERWRDLGVADRDFRMEFLDQLRESELAGLEALTAAGQLRIEQERIRLDVAVDMLNRALADIIGPGPGGEQGFQATRIAPPRATG